ncbi:hypothetical protein MPSEU_000626200 [Mayamaea pseudoterrestris]|nr:hypothetical protein MPSEU_000626200 [Mayamaea pseudoterrestris]
MIKATASTPNTSSSTTNTTQTQHRPTGWCSVAVPLILLAGLVHLTNVTYLHRKGNLLAPSKTIDTAAFSIREGSNDHDDYPQIVWLMSFPNSGTSYTISNTEHLTGKTTATNYGVPEVHDDPPMVVRPDQTVSPYWHYSALPKPARTLTKTHCRTVLNYRDFEEGCRTIQINNSTGHPEEYQYNASLVTAAVHLVRHPLDNIVSRKHHMLRKEINLGILSAEQAQTQFDDSAQGLNKWCSYKLQKTKSWLQFPQSSLDHNVAKHLSDVPCYGDLLYYIQWHNMATKTLHEYKVPSHILYYEDYAKKSYNATVQRLYDFVFDAPETPLNWTNQLAFEDSKIYHDYFTAEQRLAVEQAVRKLATPSAWQILRRYYEIDNDDDNAATNATVQNADAEHGGG